MARITHTVRETKTKTTTIHTDERTKTPKKPIKKVKIGRFDTDVDDPR